MVMSAANAAAEDHTVYVVNPGQRTVSWDEQWLFVFEPAQGYVAVFDA
jgi:hypothetical protein